MCLVNKVKWWVPHARQINQWKFNIPSSNKDIDVPYKLNTLPYSEMFFNKRGSANINSNVTQR